MTRSVVALAIRTGIPPAAWLAEGGRVIATAWDLLDAADEQQDQGQAPEHDDGRQYGG